MVFGFTAASASVRPGYLGRVPFRWVVRWRGTQGKGSPLWVDSPADNADTLGRSSL